MRSQTSSLQASNRSRNLVSGTRPHSARASTKLSNSESHLHSGLVSRQWRSAMEVELVLFFAAASHVSEGVPQGTNTALKLSTKAFTVSSTASAHLATVKLSTSMSSRQSHTGLSKAEEASELVLASAMHCSTSLAAALMSPPHADCAHMSKSWSRAAGRARLQPSSSPSKASYTSMQSHTGLASMHLPTAAWVEVTASKSHVMSVEPHLSMTSSRSLGAALPHAFSSSR
mmetsp:Transcript_80182/g.141509  ORF Transcript_80182/g.141509 Transcript_80182/m.141509 type:complete len:230 (+) Transcript_80182:1543-2232(+)